MASARDRCGRDIKAHGRTGHDPFGNMASRSDERKEVCLGQLCAKRSDECGQRHLTCRNGPRHLLFEVTAAIMTRERGRPVRRLRTMP